jgi:tetratricopeptide (TPR) repeat protein
MSGKTRKEQIREMLAEDPNDSFLRYGLAMACVSEGADVEAVRCFQDLLGIDSGYVPAYMQGGQTLVRLARIDEARELWQRGIEAARRKGDQHAAEEMQGMIDNLS